MRFVALFALLSLAACDGTSADDTDTGAGTDTSSDTGSDTASDMAGPSWANDVQPVLNDFCGSCHGGTSCPSGVCWLEDYAVLTGAASATVCAGSTIAECIPVRILDGSMPRNGACPPGSPGCMTQDEFDTLQAWGDAGAPNN